VAQAFEFPERVSVRFHHRNFGNERADAGTGSQASRAAGKVDGLPGFPHVGHVRAHHVWGPKEVVAMPRSGPKLG
jgi:hypothetical protein